MPGGGGPKSKLKFYTQWTTWTVALQAPLSMGFSRQEYLSGLPLPPAGNLPDARIEPMSPVLAGEFFTTQPPGKTNLIPEKPYA